MADRVVVVDLETTGLDPDRHELYEFAVVTENGGMWSAWVWPDLTVADPAALRLGRFYERKPDDLEHRAGSAVVQGSDGWEVCDSWDVAERLACEFSGAHLAGACPWFDAAFLERFLHRHGHAPAWSHRLIDVESMALPVLGLAVSPGLSEIARLLEIDPDPDQAHTATGDAWLAWQVRGELMARDAYCPDCCGPSGETA
jgi:hypothetical protein